MTTAMLLVELRSAMVVVVVTWVSGGGHSRTRY
jgi:hypothetical protein